jgi:hypothetical protein
MPWPHVELRKVLALDLDQVQARADTTFKMVGVYSFGRGLFKKEPVLGTDTSYRFFYRLKPDHIVMSQLFGWEGALALSSEEFAGHFVSPQFPTFLCDATRLDRQFLGWLFQMHTFWEDLGTRTRGMGDRRRTLNPEALLSMTTPLPRLDEQRRIVSRIEQLAAKVEEACGLRSQVAAELEAMLLASADRVFRSEGTTFVGDFARIQSGYAFKSDWFTDSGIRLVRNVNIGHGHIMWNETARIPEDRRGQFDRFQLSRGDILVSLDRPIISTGVKVARVTDDDLPSLLLQRVGRVCFVREGVLPEYFFAWLRSPRFTLAIDPGRSNGVPHISPKAVERIPFAPPPMEEQLRVVAYLGDFHSKVDALRKLQSETAVELDALMPSILSRAFRGEL